MENASDLELQIFHNLLSYMSYGIFMVNIVEDNEYVTECIKKLLYYIICYVPASGVG